jgi:hypothetical protein
MSFLTWLRARNKQPINCGRRGGARQPHRCCPTLERLEDRTQPSVITVTGTGDDAGTLTNFGIPGQFFDTTLRGAINAANTDPTVADPTGIHIEFDPTVFVPPMNAIMVSSALPPITQSNVHIDDNGVPVTLDGTNANSAIGLEIQAADCQISALTIQNFSEFGIGIALAGLGATGNRINVARISNNGAGVVVADGANGNTIGKEGLPPGSYSQVIDGNAVGIGITGAGTTQNVVEGNRIGADPQNPGRGGNTSGVWLLNGAHDNTIGGQNGGAGNIMVSDLQAIEVSDGAHDNTIGSLSSGSGNIIAGNSFAGIWIRGTGTTGNRVQGNLIGSLVPNSVVGNGAGVRIEGGASNNTIGGSSSASNTIVNNTGAGVVVNDDGSYGNAVRINQIFSNAVQVSNGFSKEGSIGIDLGGDGVTPNTTGGPHTGPNHLQNYPVLSTPIPNAMTAHNTLNYTLNSTPGQTFIVDFYASAGPDPSGHVEGQAWIGPQQVMTDPMTGNYSGTLIYSPVPGMPFITATATSASGDTSEFSVPMAPPHVRFLNRSLQVDADPGQKFRVQADPNYPGLLDLEWDNDPSTLVSIDPTAFSEMDFTGSSDNEIDIEDVPAGTTLSVDAGTGNPVVNIGPTGQDLNSIQGNLNIKGSGTGALVFDDQNHAAADGYTLTDGTLSRPNAANITYSGLSAVTLNGGAGLGRTYEINNTAYGASTKVTTANGDDVVNVEATTGPLTVAAKVPGSGNPTVNVSPVAQNLGNMRGPVSVDGICGGPWEATLNIYDKNDPLSNMYTLTDSGLSDKQSGGISYSMVSTLNLFGSSLPDTYNIQNTSSLASTALYSNNGGDVINVEAANGPLAVNLPASGNPTVNISPKAQNLDDIPGSLTVAGQGFGTVVLNDQAAPVANSYTLTASSFSRPKFGGLGYSGLASLTLNPTPNNNPNSQPPIFVLGTPSGMQTTINDPNGFHTISVGLPNGNPFGIPGTALDSILGPITVNSQARQDTLDLYDSASSATKTYSLYANSIAVSAINGTPVATPVPISWQGPLGVVVLFGSTAADTYQLQTMPAGLAALVVGGASTANTFQSLVPDPHTWLIYSNTSVTTAVAPGQYVIFEGVYNFAGGPGGDDFQFTPNYGHAGQLNGMLNGNGGTLDYSQDSSPITVNLANNSASNVNGGTAGGFSNISSVIGNNSSTTLIGPDLSNYWNITGNNQGNLGQAPGQTGSFTFNQVPNLIGGAADDSFVFQQGGSISGTLDGGGGTNTLDYSQYAGNIMVDLGLNLASLVNGGAAGSVFDIANVTGSQGNDLIVGDANPNVLVGGTGRNVIIGDGGSDTITGGGGFNLLIGGITSYDTNLAALQALMTYWDNPNATTLDQLVNPLKKGVTVNGQFLVLNRTTVKTDNAADSLIGGSGPTWFIVDKDGDTINHGKGPRLLDRLTVI